MARIKGIRVTPTIILGKSRFEGECAPGQLESKVESCVELSSCQAQIA